jgi:hypothetical protein
MTVGQLFLIQGNDQRVITHTSDLKARQTGNTRMNRICQRFECSHWAYSPTLLPIVEQKWPMIFAQNRHTSQGMHTESRTDLAKASGYSTHRIG